MKINNSEYRIILGNSNKRFSGVTSTMLQVLKVQHQLESIAVLGSYHLPNGIKSFTFFELAKVAKKPLVDGKFRVFHARRNNEMIQALLLKIIFGCKLKIVFTSTAQRKKTWITRWLMSQMDGLITTCSAAKSYMHIQPDVIIPHGIDADIYTPSAEKSNKISLPGKHNIGIFGRVRAQKGVDILIDAALALLPAHPDWGIVVVGETTPDQEFFKKQLIDKLSAANLESKILFTGTLPFQQLPSLFASVDIVTALSRNEGFGLTVLEAMSSGKPVVASMAGAWPDIIEDGVDGFLVKHEQLDSVITTLESLMQEKNLRKNIGLQARSKIVNHYQVKKEATELLSFYHSLP